jgi:hypothetical protein
MPRKLTEDQARELLRLRSLNVDDSDADADYDNSDSDEEYIPESSLEEAEGDDDSILGRDLILETIDRVIQEAEGNTDDQCQINNTAVDEGIYKTSSANVVWKKLDVGSETRIRNRIQFRSMGGLTSYAKRRIDQSAFSAFNLIFCSSMIR